MKEIEKFCNSAIVIIIREILDLDIIIPRIMFDYTIDPGIDFDIYKGYYMYKNAAGDAIVLNMNSILELKNDSDIKTVITYGFIHEIVHMFQDINSNYFKNNIYYTTIEDTADYQTISIIRDNMINILYRLGFEVSVPFIRGIERQLELHDNSPYDLNMVSYNKNIITGALCNKLNVNYDNIRSLLDSTNILRVIFPNKREYNISLYGNTFDEINILINLIQLTDFNFIHIKDAKPEGWRAVLVLELVNACDAK